jgi:CheY-like chemotaxis protein
MGGGAKTSDSRITEGKRSGLDVLRRTKKSGKWREILLPIIFRKRNLFYGSNSATVRKLSIPIDNDETPTFQLLQQAETRRVAVEELVRLQVAKSDLEGKEASILVVDDSDAMRDVICMTLRALGYRDLCEAGDGKAALDLLYKREFDLLVLDIDMPGVDGYEVLRVLKNDSVRCHMPVIVASGLEQLDAVVRCIELGAEDFLPKPVNSVLLGARIEASLDRKRLRDRD